MMLSNLCLDLRNACERAYEQVSDVLTTGSGQAGPRRQEYEKLTRDDGGDHAPKNLETMDRGVAQELVDLAVSGVASKKSSRPGGETFSGPPNITTSKVVSSETFKELNEPIQNSANSGSSDQLEYCRAEESKLFSKLRVFRDEEAAMDSDEAIYLVDARWFDDWSKFLKGGKRPGSILNAAVDQRKGKWNKNYVGLDGRGWGILSDLYKFDKIVLFEFEG